MRNNANRGLSNTPGNELYKSSMVSGTWVIVTQGDTFAWMRTFTIIAGPQTTITATPIAIFSMSSTPSTTINSTITSDFNTSLTPVTDVTVIPSTTVIKTSTITPSKVTVTTTSIATKTKASTTVYSKISTTVTKTLTCKTQTPKKDPICTLSLSNTGLPASSANATVTKRALFAKRTAGEYLKSI